MPRYPRPKERYERFRLNPESPLYHGLIYAGLGDGAGGTRYLDSSPLQLHGALVNMPASAWRWDATLNRFVLWFDGVDDYVTIDHNRIYSATTRRKQIAIHCWANWTSATGNAKGIVAVGYAGSNGYLAQITTGYLDSGQDKIGFSYSENPSRVARWYWNAGSSLNDGQWHSLCGLGYSPRIGTEAPDGAVYVDGASKSFHAGTACCAGRGLGRNQYGPFEGYVADPLIFDRPLVEAEIAALADPHNVDLRVGGVPLILPQRRWWPGVAVAKRVPWHLLIQGAA